MSEAALLLSIPEARVLSLRDPLVEKDLPEAARKDLDFWRGLLSPVLREKRGVTEHLKRIAQMSGQPFRTVEKRYYAAKKLGIVGLVDKRLAGPKFWKLRTHRVAPNVSQSKGLQQLWKKLCGENQRKCRPQFKVLKQMWKTRHKDIAAIPEYSDFPGWPKLPQGWTYGNLMRYAPTAFEFAAIREGRAGAAAHRRTVFGTRVGCYVGSHLMIDDKWNDFFVNSFADLQAGRPLEVYTLDYFSARKCRWATRVRTKDQEGNYKGIAEIMTRYVLAAHLFLDGYSPRGTTIVAEHGTAAVREQVAAALHQITGGLITLSESGMTGAVAHAGQYPGLRRGNPRHKAALESNNNREHNAFAALPGQTGMSVERRPEELTGRLAYNANLLAAYSQLPAERAALLDFPVLELNQYLGIADHIYRLLEDDREHELEGWVEAGNVVQAFQFGDKEVLETQLSAQERAAVVAMLEAGVLKARPVRMSRREVWDRGAGELVKLPGWGVCAILGDDLAREVTVVDDMVSIRDSEWWPGTYRFETEGRDAEGRYFRLAEGQKYQAFINPFADRTLFLRDAQGRYLGECRRINAPSRADIEGVQRAMGEAAKAEGALLQPVRARHLAEAREKLARHRHNAAVINPGSTPEAQAEQRTKQERRAVVDAELAAAAAALPTEEPTAGGLYGTETDS